MKLVGESSLHNKKKDEKIRLMMELRAKKDEDERIRLEQKKKEDAERLEEYYISLKYMDNYETEVKETSAVDNIISNAGKSKLRRSFFTTDLAEY